MKLFTSALHSSVACFYNNCTDDTACRKKERGSPDSIHSVSTLPLRERIERRLKGDQGNQKDQVKKGMENG